MLVQPIIYILLKGLNILKGKKKAQKEDLSLSNLLLKSMVITAF